MTAGFLSCSRTPEIENASADLNKDSILTNVDTLSVVSKKYILKSNESEAWMEWPEIYGNVSMGSLMKMNTVISVDSVCGESIGAIQLNYKECSCGTVGSSYSINYNKNYILSLSIALETMGAYPDGYLESYNFNIKTGERLFIESLIKKDSLDPLLRNLNAELTKRIEEAKAIADEDAEKSGDTESINDLFTKTEFSKEDLKNFIITDKGITFYFEFGFPHAVQALEPPGDFSIPKEELKPYLEREIVL
jgi:hypothetical protein